MKLKMVVVDLELSARSKRWIAALAMGLLVSAAAIASATPAHVWMDGNVLTAKDLNDTFKALDDQAMTLTAQVAAVTAQASMLDGRVMTLEQTSKAQPAIDLARLAVYNAALPGGSSQTLSGTPLDPSTTQIVWQAATTVEVTDASGAMVVSFPQSFPHGVLTVIAQDGDFSTGANVKPVSLDSYSNGGFKAHVAAGNGAAWGNTITRINWIALGW